MRFSCLVFLFSLILPLSPSAQTVSSDAGGRLGVSALFYFGDEIANKRLARSMLEQEGFDYVTHYVCLGVETCGHKRPLSAMRATPRVQPYLTQMTLVGHDPDKGTIAFLVVDAPCRSLVTLDDVKRPRAGKAKPRLAEKLAKPGDGLKAEAGLRGGVQDEPDTMCFAGTMLLARSVYSNLFSQNGDGWTHEQRQVMQVPDKRKWKTTAILSLRETQAGRSLMSDGWTSDERALIVGEDGLVLHDDTVHTFYIAQSSDAEVTVIEKCESYAKARMLGDRQINDFIGGQCDNMWQSGLLGWATELTVNIEVVKANIPVPDPCGYGRELMEGASAALEDMLFKECLADPSIADHYNAVMLEHHAGQIYFIEPKVIEVEEVAPEMEEMAEGSQCENWSESKTETVTIDGQTCIQTTSTECDTSCNCTTVVTENCDVGDTKLP